MQPALALLALLAAPPTAVFEDATSAVGLDFEYRNFMTGALHLPEIMGPGAALFDADNDGDLDLFIVQGARLGPQGEPPSPALPAAPDERPRFFRNDSRPGPHGTRVPRFALASDAIGPLPAGYGLGVASGDYDGDGFVDLYLTRYGASRLLRNVEGKRFEDVSAAAGVELEGWSASAAFVDYDRDGHLDLYVVQYVEYAPVKCIRASTRRDYCGPKSYRPRLSRLYRNRGDGRFEDAARVLTPARAGPGLGVVSLDADGDDWLDLYVANDGFDNFLWLNRKGRELREDGLLAGVALNRGGLPEAGMGVDAADVTGDGLEDLFVTNLSQETNTLYVNLGGGLFEDRTLASGLGPPSLPWTGFGTRLFDFDNDGALDIVVVNGAVHLPEEPDDPRDPLPLGQPKLLFRNLGKGTFADVSAQGGEPLTRREVSRGLAAGDLDDDGDLDLVVANTIGPSRVLLNRVGQDAPWLGLRLLLADGKRDALGARVTLRRRGAADLVRRARSDGSYASAGDPRVLFGLGGGTDVLGVDVQWPDGRRESFPAPPLRRYTTLRQGGGQASASGRTAAWPRRHGDTETARVPAPRDARAAVPGAPRSPRRGERDGVTGRALRRPLTSARSIQPLVQRARLSRRPTRRAESPQARPTPPAGASRAASSIPFPSLDGAEPAVAAQLAEVRTQLERTQRDGSATHETYGDAGRHYHAYGLHAAAEACYRRAAELAPADYRWPHLLGVLYESTGQLDEAAAAFEHTLRAPDKYYPAFIRLAAVELARGRLDAAGAALEAPRAHAPEDPALLAALGELALAQGRAEDARARLEAALERQPKATRLHYPLGLALRALGRTDEARAHLARAGRIGVQPRDPLLESVRALRRGENAYLMEGHTAYRAGDFPAAAAAYARAFEASGSTSSGALANLAATEQRQGRTAEALAHLEQARALDPEAPTVLFNLGLLLRQAGREADALPHLRRLVERQPQDTEARAELALNLLALDLAAEALDVLAASGRMPGGRCAALNAALLRLAGQADAALRARAEAARSRLAGAQGCSP